MSKVDLKLDWCSYQAAKYAVEKWHYSKVIPAGKNVCIGVWENTKFIGTVIYGSGANNNIGKPYGLPMTKICEMVRVALYNHVSAVSRIVAISMRMLRIQSDGLRLIISYADPAHGHVGSIYQAMNWVYCGKSQPQAAVKINGKLVHKKSASSMFGCIKGLPKSEVTWKYKYLYPLDESMRKQIEPLRKPYPKRATGEVRNALDLTSQETGGANPTVALY